MTEAMTLRRWATPLTIGASVLMIATGVMMFFDDVPGYVTFAHEWFTWLFVLGVVFLSDWPIRAQGHPRQAKHPVPILPATPATAGLCPALTSVKDLPQKAGHAMNAWSVAWHFGAEGHQLGHLVKLLAIRIGGLVLAATCAISGGPTRARADVRGSNGNSRASGCRAKRALKFGLFCNISSYMKRDSRLSSVLHAVLHLAGQDGPVTSDTLAQCLGTNPVVVRRTMGYLRQAGIVASDRGHSGGWRITADLGRITLRQLHEALGEPAIFAIGNRNETPQCLVEQTVNAALEGSFAEAEALLLKRFSEITLADLAADFARRHAAVRHARKRT